ncbi:MAG: saccharopine dehydrogenase NADP-binding domain-containing protein [Desulfobacterales bacterium]|nr:saccharopine dehydrogenase NADP-binding domain-containing protein [Desulfobacterales bacterium]
MKILVIGCGKMGSVIAWDLSKYNDIETIGLADPYAPSLEKASKRIQGKNVETYLLKGNYRKQLIELMQSYDVSIGAQPTIKQGNELIEDAIEAEVNLVDIIGEYYRRPNEAYLDGFNVPQGMTGGEYGEILHRRAKDKNITILCCIGFAPGLSNLTLGYGISQMDKAETAIARVGGMPDIKVAEKYPMKYMATWCWDQAIDSAMDETRILKDGKLQYAKAMSEYERFRFQELGKDVELEAFLTPGMDSFIFTRPELKSCYEKTIRWPGYKDYMSFLESCGFFDLKPIVFNGQEIVPREISARIMEPGLMAKKGDTDVSIMWNTVTGEKAGRSAQIDYYMWVDSDTENRISSMGRATAYPASVSAVMMGRGRFTNRGILTPEDAFDEDCYQFLLRELKNKGIIIEESIA